MAERSSGNTIQIVILVLLAMNLALTGMLWLDRSNDYTVDEQKGTNLPAFASADELSRLAGEIQELYNSRDLEGLYDLFDDVAKVQITLEQLDEQLGSFNDVLGKIDSYAFSHSQATAYEGQPVHILHYKVRLVDGSFPTGTLKITAIVRGDQFRLFGFNLFGGTGP